MALSWQRTSAPADPALQAGAVVSGVVATFLVSLLAAGAVALVVVLTPLTEQRAGGALFVTGLLSLCIGAGYGARRAHGRGWIHGLLVGALYVGCSLVLEPLLFPGVMTFPGALLRLVLGMGTGALGGVVGVNL
jgi:putative membrane protein (TIGR04086 family)